MHSAKRGGRARAGFTLIEVMIAIIVLLVAVLSTYTAQISARNLMRTSRETNAATSDLQTAMDRALLVPADQLPIASSAFAENTKVAEFEGLHLNGESIVTTYPGYVAGDAIPDPLSIVMTLSWTDFRGRQRTLRLSSMKTR